MSDYHRCALMIVLGGACLSIAGLTIRLLDGATGLSIVFYRALGMAIFLALYLCWRHRQATAKVFLRIGYVGLWAGLFFALASIAIIFAFLNTTVANTVFIVSLAPLIAALLARILLKESVHSSTWLAMGLAIIGVSIMINGDLSGSGLLGMAFAALMCFCYGAFTVALRAGKDRDMLPALCLSGFLLAVCVSPWANFSEVSLHDKLLCLALGVFQVGLGGLLITLGSQHVPAAQITLLAMSEAVLAPIWVWLGVGETPSLSTLVGGSIIFAAIIYQSLQSQQS